MLPESSQASPNPRTGHGSKCRQARDTRQLGRDNRSSENDKGVPRGEGHGIRAGAGAGRTRRQRPRELCPDLTFAGDATEAQIFSSYVSHVHGLKADLLETRSTNCGNNITYLRDLLADRGISCKSLILSQDATMQRRMVALAAKEMPGVQPIAFATYSVRVTVRDGALAYDHAPLGMWDMSRYLTLLMGEIPRLTDDENGYGPRGKGFLAHVDIPTQARGAWDRLLERYPWSMRTADPRYAG